MDEFFFDANDRDKPAHVTGFHDIGGGGFGSAGATKTMKIDESIMSAVIDNRIPIIASNNNIGSIAHHNNKQPFEQSGVFFEPTRNNADRTLVDFKPLPFHSHSSKHIDRVMRIATKQSDIAGNNTPAEEDNETSPPSSPVWSDLGDGNFSDITEEYSNDSDDDGSDINAVRASASAAASQSARDARSASTRAQMAVNRMRNAQKTSTGAAASTARSAAKAARTAATSASLSSTAATYGQMRDQLQGEKERTDKNYKTMSTLVSDYIKNPAVHKFDDQKSEKKLTKLAQTLRNPDNATKTGLRATTIKKIGNIRSWQTSKMRRQLRANMKPMPRRTTSKVKNSEE